MVYPELEALYLISSAYASDDEYEPMYTTELPVAYTDPTVRLFVLFLTCNEPTNEPSARFSARI